MSETSDSRPRPLPIEAAPSAPADDAHQPYRPSTEFTPWMIVGAIGMGALVLIALVLGIAAMLYVPPEPQRGLQTVQMPDGTLLVLEGVTYGTSHELVVPLDVESSGFFTSVPEHRVNRSAPEGYVIYLSCWTRNGQPLELDWWSHCEAVDDHGCVVSDYNAGLSMHDGGYGTSSFHGDRPLSSTARGHGFARPASIIGHSVIPRLRVSGRTFPLRVYDTSGTLVAEFAAPNLDPGGIPTWTPEPLPTTSGSSPLAVTLEDLGPRYDTWTEEGRERSVLSLQPRFAYVERGAASDDWSHQNVQLRDPLGNVHSSQTPLCRHEPAWKLTVDVFRRDEAALPADTWTVPDLPLPERARIERVELAQRLHGEPVEVLALGGPGTVIHRLGTGSASSGSSTHYSSAFSERVRVETKPDASGIRTMTVKSEFPHVVLNFDPRLSLRLSLLVRDEQGRDVLTSQLQQQHASVWFLKPEPDVQRVTLQVIVQPRQTFEFIVAPPTLEPPPAEPPQADASAASNGDPD